MMDIVRQLLAKNLKRLRAEQDLTQSGLAEKSDYSVNMIGQIENGTVNPSTETIARIAAAFGCEVAELFSTGKRHKISQKLDPLPKPSPEIIKQLLESSPETLPSFAVSIMVEQFAESPEKLRALVLALLYHDFEICRNFEYDLVELMPKAKAR